MGDTSMLAKLIAVIFLAVGFFLFCYLASPRKTVPWLICLSPYQLIDTPYSSSSVVLAYVVAIAFILRGKFHYLPIFGVMFAIMLVYIGSAGLAPRAYHVPHGLYIFNYFSAILVFYIVYNFVRETKDLELIIKTLIILNVSVVIHGLIQVTIGPLSLFGLEEVRMYGPRTRGEDPRLTGPYVSPTQVADFFVMFVFFIGYLLIHVKSVTKRNLLFLLMAANLACLLMTANRGGFLALIGGAALFLFMFRSQLGVKRTFNLSIAGTFLLALMSVIVINFTDYGAMYQRLSETEFEEGGMPDTRAGTWSRIASQIGDKPLLGHGPRFPVQDDLDKGLTNPHNLFLFLLYTVGIIGLGVYLVFFSLIVMRLRNAVKRSTEDAFKSGFIKLGLLLMVVFLVGQLKIEFVRPALADYTQFVFIFFAIWLALADIVRAGNFPKSQ